MPKKKYTFIDLFAGLGGFHLALQSLGCKCVFASELQPDLQKLYAINFGMECFGDIKTIDITKIPSHDILCAGFPCQPFSHAGKQKGFEDEGRGNMFYTIIDILREKKPKYLLLENVANLRNHDNGRTWSTIEKELHNVGYNTKDIILSPHQFGFPQHRKRIYIVGMRKDLGNNKDFHFPTPTNKPCNIKEIIEKENPTNPQPLKPIQRYYIDVWQQFLDLCGKYHAKLPSAPIWAMEFGADYDFEGNAPAFQPITQLRKRHGKLGFLINGKTKKECLSQLPNYAQTNKNKTFPDWKKKFIRENRKFYEANKEWVDVWKQNIVNWENSFLKFEWNCEETEHMTIADKILQFRPSGVRVKRPTYSPALTYMSSQVPIFPGITYTDKEGNEVQGRFMTMVEAARIQGMRELSFEGLNKARIYEALGNAVDVEIVKIIAKNLIKYAK